MTKPADGLRQQEPKTKCWSLTRSNFRNRQHSKKKKLKVCSQKKNFKLSREAFFIFRLKKFFFCLGQDFFIWARLRNFFSFLSFVCFQILICLKISGIVKPKIRAKNNSIGINQNHNSNISTNNINNEVVLSCAQIWNTWKKIQGNWKCLFNFKTTRVLNKTRCKALACLKRCLCLNKRQFYEL